MFFFHYSETLLKGYPKLAETGIIWYYNDGCELSELPWTTTGAIL